jgi:hypothetical protein
MMAQETKLPKDEERRLLTASEECFGKQRALADQLLNPRRSMLYPEVMRLTNAFQSIRIECKKKWLALRAYQKKMRDDRREGKRNSAVLLQARPLFIVATHPVHAPPKDANGPR